MLVTLKPSGGRGHPWVLGGQGVQPPCLGWTRQGPCEGPRIRESCCLGWGPHLVLLQVLLVLRDPLWCQLRARQGPYPLDYLSGLWLGNPEVPIQVAAAPKPCAEVRVLGPGFHACQAGWSVLSRRGSEPPWLQLCHAGGREGSHCSAYYYF